RPGGGGARSARSRPPDGSPPRVSTSSDGALLRPRRRRLSRLRGRAAERTAATGPPGRRGDARQRTRSRLPPRLAGGAPGHLSPRPDAHDRGGGRGRGGDLDRVPDPPPAPEGGAVGSPLGGGDLCVASRNRLV